MEPPCLGMNYVIQLDMKGIGRISVEVLEKMPLVDSPDAPPRGIALVMWGKLGVVGKLGVGMHNSTNEPEKT